VVANHLRSTSFQLAALKQKLCEHASSSRKSVQSSQVFDEMEVSSQDYLFDSPWTEEDKSVIKDYIQYHRE